jgi:hypothetical protein
MREFRPDDDHGHSEPAVAAQRIVATVAAAGHRRNATLPRKLFKR